MKKYKCLYVFIYYYIMLFNLDESNEHREYMHMYSEIQL